MRMTAWRWGWRRKGKLGKGTKQRKKFHIKSIQDQYFWVPGGTVHPNVHVNDRDFFDDRKENA